MKLTLSAPPSHRAGGVGPHIAADITSEHRKPDAACPDTWHGERCARPADHDGLHTSGRLTWGFRDNSIPEWVRRAQARALPAKDYAR